MIGWGYAYELEILPCSEAFPLFSQTASKVRLKTNFCEATVILSRLPPNATAFRHRNETNCRLRVVYNFGEKYGCGRNACVVRDSHDTRSHDTRGVLKIRRFLESRDVGISPALLFFTEIRADYLQSYPLKSYLLSMISGSVILVFVM